MKKTTLILVILFFTYTIGFGQESDHPVQPGNTNSLGFDLYKVAFSTLVVDYERVLNEKSSIFISGGITLKINEEEEWGGGIGEVQYRMYSYRKMYEESLFGFYFAPYGKYQYLDIKDINSWDSTYTFDSYQSISGGFLLGVKFIYSDKFFVDFNVGGGIRYVFNQKQLNDNYFGAQRLDYTGVYPQSNLIVGFTF